MKSAIFSIGLIFVALITLSGCGLREANDEAAKEISKFHKHMKNGNHSAMVNMFDDEALRATPRREILTLFERIEQFGKVKNVTQNMGFNSSINNGVTTVELSYTIEFEDRTMQEEFTMRKTGDKFKILGYFIQ